MIKAYIVYDTTDEMKECIFVAAKNPSRARAVAREYFKDSVYFNLRSTRCFEIDKYMPKYEKYFTGKNKDIYEMIKAAGFCYELTKED